jgi:hypothetical protein
MIEYGLISSLVAVVTILAVAVTGVNLACLYWDLHNVVADNGEQACPYGPAYDTDGDSDELPSDPFGFSLCGDLPGCVSCCIAAYDACMDAGGNDLEAWKSCHPANQECQDLC